MTNKVKRVGPDAMGFLIQFYYVSQHLYMGLDATKPFLGVPDKARLKTVSLATEIS